MAGKRAAADVLAEWEQKMKDKAAQAGGMASGAYDQVTQGGVEPEGVPLKSVPQAMGYAQGASMGRGAQDIYDQVQSKTPGSMGSMMDTVQNGMPSGAEIAGGAQAMGQDVMALLQQLPPQIQQKIQEAVQSGQVTVEQVAQKLQEMQGGGPKAPYPDAGGLMTDNANAINSNMLPPGMMQQPGGTGQIENEAISKLQEMGVPITPENVQMYMKMKAGAGDMMQQGMDSAKGLLQ